MAAAAKQERTKTPGVYKRGERYAITYRDHLGKQRWESARTYDEARAIKRRRDQQAHDGEAHIAARDQVTLAAYALDLYGADTSRTPTVAPAKGRYQGRRGAVRDATRDDYRRDCETYWLPLLGAKRLPAIGAPDIARALATLAGRDGGDYLADRTLKRVFAPLSALMATAVEEGVIRHNPARDVTVPSGRDRLRRFDDDVEDEEREARPYTRSQIAALLRVVPQPDHRLLLRVLASTGLRISEAIALRWRDLQLDGSTPHVKVRRALVKGKVGPPKSEYGRRDVPIAHGLVVALREHRRGSQWPRPDDPVFCSSVGTPLRPENLRRALAPFFEEVDVACRFHAFRHAFASMLIEDGRNIVQVSRLLGHHSPSFTLTVYAHLMDGGTGGPLELMSAPEVQGSSAEPVFARH